MPKKKILIADDDKEAAFFLQKGLEREGFEVSVAIDGQEAQTQIEKQKPDLLILDLIMPQRNGWQVLEWLRREVKSSLPVIVVSAKDELPDMQKSYLLKADTHLVKPIEIENVMAAVNAIFSMRTE